MATMMRQVRWSAAGLLAVLAACGGEGGEAEARVPPDDLRVPPAELAALTYDQYRDIRRCYHPRP